MYRNQSLSNIPRIILSIVLGFILASQKSFAQDPNFHIYLCFGQSNMEGASPYEPQDTSSNDRFLLLSAVDCPGLNRSQGEWYIAKPPIARCNTGITPVDYFGKTLIENLPDSIRVGVINVAVGGCRIALFDRDSTAAYVKVAPDWMKNILKAYDNVPYARLIELAKTAQKTGIIKGILLHQGESNTGEKTWPEQVAKIYHNILDELSLNAAEVPLLAGQVLNAEQKGKCASMNNIINTVPSAISTAHIVSSKDCTAASDNIHFSSEGYRTLGENYAKVMLALLK